MKNKISFYSKSVLAKRSKKTLAYVLDLVIMLIILALFFAFCELISNNSASVKNNKNYANEKQNELFEIVYESKLDESNNLGGLKGKEAIARENIYSFTYEALKYYQFDNISLKTYQGVVPINTENDNSYYYFVTYKSNNLSKFNKQENYGLDYYSKILFNEIDKNYFVLRNDFYYLTKETAINLDQYLRGENTENAKKTYDLFYDGLVSILNLGINDFTSTYLPYLDTNAEFEKTTNFLLNVKIYSLFASYSASLIVTFLIIPLILKDGRSISFKVLNLAFCTTKGEKLDWYNYLIKLIFNYVEFFFLIPIICLIFFSTDALTLFNIVIFGFTNLLTLGFFSILLLLFSFIYSFVNKNHQTFAEFLSYIICKDGSLFKMNKEEKKDVRRN